MSPENLQKILYSSQRRVKAKPSVCGAECDADCFELGTRKKEQTITHQLPEIRSSAGRYHIGDCDSNGASARLIGCVQQPAPLAAQYRHFHSSTQHTNHSCRFWISADKKSQKDVCRILL